MPRYISECPIVPDPELNWNEMPKSFQGAINDALEMLRSKGINDNVQTRLTTFTGERRCWLALYMRNSQFRGDPIVEINTQTPGIIDAAVLPQHMTVEDVFLDSFLHEYGHVIEEWAKVKDRDMYRIIYGPFSDEEDFAEYMVDFFRYHKDRSPRTNVANEVVRLYVRDVF